MKSKVLLDATLKELRLPTFLSEYARASRECADNDNSYENFLEHLANLELATRKRNAIQRRLKEACFPAEKELGDFDYTAIPKLNKKRIQELSKSTYLLRKECLVFLGPPGVGKTHLAIGLAREACRQGKRVKFFTANGLATAYAEARTDRVLQRLENAIDKRDLIIIDELGYVPLANGAAEDLFNFFSRCYERTSLIVTTNLPFSEWPQIFGDEALTGALLDRLTHRVHIIEMPGESYHMKYSQKRNQNSTKSHPGGKEGAKPTQK